MSEHLNQFYATDKDIFDLLASAKQREPPRVSRRLVGLSQAVAA